MRYTCGRLRHFVPAAALLASVTLPAHAQNYEHVAPKLPPKTETPVIVLPPEAASSGNSAAILTNHLVGLVFVESQGQIAPGGAPARTNGVDASRVPLLDDPRFAARLLPFLNRPLSFTTLDEIRQITYKWLRDHKRPFGAVTVPPQNVSGGVIQIVVTQYRLGKIEVEGARYFSPVLIRSMSGLKTGQPLRLDHLQSDLARLNQNPFLNIDAVFKPGTEPAETDILLTARDRLPFRAYAGYDNLGVRSLGVGEYNIGLNWGNAFGTGQVLSYQFTRSVSGRFTSHSASDVVPLPWGDKLLIFGSYGVQRPRLPDIFHDVGHSGQASMRYVHNLPPVAGFEHDLQVGFDFKTTDNNLEFAGFQVFATRAEVDQFPIIYDATLSDSLGQTAVQNIFVFSPGHLTARNTTQDLAALVTGSRSQYVYDRLLVTRTTRLPLGLASITRATAQISNHNLPNSEQLGGGGIGSVRGYYADTALGSKGVIASQELRLPPISLSKLLDSRPKANDQLQFGAFFDYAHLAQITPIPDIENTVDLASAGINAHFSVTRFFDAQCDLGWRLKRTATAPERGAYAQVSVTAGF